MDELVKNPLIILNSGLVVAAVVAIARWVSRVTIELEGIKKDITVINEKDLPNIHRRLEGLELRAFAVARLGGKDREHE